MLTVSVVTRTCDRPQQLQRAARSLLEQAPDSLTWSLVNDGGDPLPVEQAAGLAREHGIETVVTHHETRRGRAAAANSGVRAASSDLVLLLDDDDRLLPGAVGRLAEGLAAAPASDVGIVGQVYVVEEERGDGEGWQEVSRTIANPERGAVRIVDLAYRNFVPVNGFMYRRSAFETVAGYDEDLPVLEDWDFVLKLILLGDIGKLDEPVAEYFVRRGITDMNDPESNSVAAGHSLHEYYEARLRNRYLRKDLEDGVYGLGHLMNPPHRLPMERINVLADGMNRAARSNWLLRKLLGVIRSR